MPRRWVLFAAALCLSGCQLAALAFAKDGENAPAKRAAHATLEDERLYLFVDDHWLAEQTGAARVINRAQPLPEPVLWPDDPKTEADCAWGNVIREPDGLFRLWYATMLMGKDGGGPHEMAKAGVWGRGDDFGHHPRSPADGRDVESMLGRYAESADGIHWTKPKLGLVEFRGSRENNLVMNGERAAKQTDGLLTNFDGYTILRDDREPDATRRYKMVAHWESVHCWDNHEVSGSLGRDEKKIKRYWDARGEYLTYSPDGLRWEQPLERIKMPTGGGDRLLVVPDHRHSRWMAYVRAGGWSYPALSYSRDLKDWSEPEAAKAITPASVKAPAVECLIPFNYGNLDLGFPCGMDKPRGVLTPLLAARHEGGDWKWVANAEPFIRFGPPSSYCASGAVPLHNEPFLVGDELLFYFNAFSRNQSPLCPFGTRSIGVARLRRDGFSGLTCAKADQPATLLTRPLRVKGEALFINVEQRETGGRVEVALLDETNRPLPGFELADATPITSDAVRHRVTWKGRDSLKTLVGKDVRIQIRMSGKAVVYAVRL